MPIALIGLIPTFIGLAESLFAKRDPEGNPTGEKKKALVTDLVLQNIDVLVQHEVMPAWVGGPAADAAISEAIEFALQKFKNPPAA